MLGVLTKTVARTMWTAGFVLAVSTAAQAQEKERLYMVNPGGTGLVKVVEKELEHRPEVGEKKVLREPNLAALPLPPAEVKKLKAAAASAKKKPAKAPALGFQKVKIAATPRNPRVEFSSRELSLTPPLQVQQEDFIKKNTSLLDVKF